jgi:hypothetical protein
VHCAVAGDNRQHIAGGNLHNHVIVPVGRIHIALGIRCHPRNLAEGRIDRRSPVSRKVKLPVARNGGDGSLRIREGRAKHKNDGGQDGPILGAHTRIIPAAPMHGPAAQAELWRLG